MFSLKYVFLMVTCVILAASASATEFADLNEHQQAALDNEYEPALLRQVRSPYGDSLDMELNDEFEPVLSRQVRSPHGQFPSGRISNTNGRGTSDAYAQATRNSDFTRRRQSRSPHGQFPSGRISNTNGRGTSDAYAQATRNSDFTRKRF